MGLFAGEEGRLLVVVVWVARYGVMRVRPMLFSMGTVDHTIIDEGFKLYLYPTLSCSIVDGAIELQVYRKLQTWGCVLRSISRGATSSLQATEGLASLSPPPSTNILPSANINPLDHVLKSQ